MNVLREGLGRWEFKIMAARYNRIVKFDDSLEIYFPIVD
jgi:hypothetical protein